MMTFKDDFDTEREEKHKSLEESRQFKSQLDEANRVIQTLSDKIAVYKEHILKLSGSQDHLRKQITALIDSENEMPNSIQRQHSQRYSYPFSSEVGFNYQNISALRTCCTFDTGCTESSSVWKY